METAIAFALLSFFCWGTGDIFATLVCRRLGSYSSNIWTQIFKLAIFGLYVPFALAFLSQMTAGIFLYCLILGVVLSVANVSYNEALRIANPSLVGTISASFTAVVFILSLTFLQESVTPLQVGSIAIVFLGMILSSTDFTSLRKRKIRSSKGVIFALVTMLLWGVYFTFIKIPVAQVGWFWPNYISAMTFPLVILVAKVRKASVPNPTFKSSLMIFLAMVILTGVAELSYNYAISSGMSAIVAPIAGSYPVLFAVLAYLVFKESVSRQQKMGIIVSLIGIVLLSVFGV
jgi:drug/metabolite transporter (DMT)-like permease